MVSMPAVERVAKADVADDVRRDLLALLVSLVAHGADLLEIEAGAELHVVIGLAHVSGRGDDLHQVGPLAQQAADRIHTLVRAVHEDAAHGGLLHEIIGQDRPVAVSAGRGEKLDGRQDTRTAAQALADTLADSDAAALGTQLAYGRIAVREQLLGVTQRADQADVVVFKIAAVGLLRVHAGHMKVRLDQAGHHELVGAVPHGETLAVKAAARRDLHDLSAVEQQIEVVGAPANPVVHGSGTQDQRSLILGGHDPASADRIIGDIHLLSTPFFAVRRLMSLGISSVAAHISHRTIQMGRVKKME